MPLLWPNFPSWLMPTKVPAPDVCNQLLFFAQSFSWQNTEFLNKQKLPQFQNYSCFQRNKCSGGEINKLGTRLTLSRKSSNLTNILGVLLLRKCFWTVELPSKHLMRRQKNNGHLQRAELPSLGTGIAFSYSVLKKYIMLFFFTSLKHMQKGSNKRKGC